jgi:hypothetical protein
MSASIFVGTPTAAIVAQGGVLPLTSILRRQCGCISALGSDSVILDRPGYYKVTATTTFTAPAAGTVTLRLTQDGNPIPAITASTSITTATTEVRSLAVSGIVRVGCCNGASALQLVNAGVAINTSNIALDVEYLG